MPRQRQTTRIAQPGAQSVHFGMFDGINNQVNHREVKPTQLYAALNVDLDPLGRPNVRPGRTKIVSAVKPHSLFSDGVTLLYVQGGTLKSLDVKDNSSTVLRQNVGDNSMSYAAVNGMVFYTNGAVIGYVKDGADYTFQEPIEPYRSVPLPGQVIGYYRGSLYICRGNEIQITEVLQFNEVDTRYGLKVLPDPITMVAPVEDGIWFATEKNIYFVEGTDPDKMVLRNMASYGNVSGSFSYIDSRLFGHKDDDPAAQPIRLGGKLIIFPTTNGLCWATNNGGFGNLTARKYAFPAFTRWASVFVQGSTNKFVCSSY